MTLKCYEHCCSSCIALVNVGKTEGIIPILHGPQACNALKNRFGSKVKYIEMPVGAQGTSAYLRGVAGITKNEKLLGIVDREEKRVFPRLEKIKAQFKKEKPKVLLVSGPSNEMSMGKILAEFGLKSSLYRPCEINSSG